MLRYRILSTPCGPLRLAIDASGLAHVDFMDEGMTTPQDWIDDAEALAPYVQQFAEWFAGTRQQFDLPLSLHGTEFQRAAWLALADIPYGDTCSYGQQASRLGRPTAVRAIGAANGRNPLPIILPCHRVIGSNGSLTGYAGGLDRKRWLLAHEAAHRSPETAHCAPDTAHRTPETV